MVMESNLITPVNTLQTENHGSLSGLVYLAANCDLTNHKFDLSTANLCSRKSVAQLKNGVKIKSRSLKYEKKRRKNFLMYDTHLTSLYFYVGIFSYYYQYFSLLFCTDLYVV